MSDLQTLIIGLITIGIPECISLTMVTVTALKLAFNWKKIWIISVSLALGVFILRLTIVKAMAIPGIHTAMAVLILALLVAHFYQISKLWSLTASVVTFFLLTATEISAYRLAEIVSGQDVLVLAQNTLLWTLINWLHIIALALVAIGVTRTNWYKRGQKSF